MGTENLLSKLTAGGIVIENMAADTTKRRSKGTGGLVGATETRTAKLLKISSSDVAAALSGLNERPYYFALAKYAGDKPATKTFLELLTALIKKMWDSINDQQAYALALLAVEGAIWFIHCKKCLGRRVVFSRQRVVRDCESCNGTGKGKINGAKAASMLGVSRSAWCQTWSNRYAILQSVLNEYDDKINSHLRRRFHDRLDT